MTSELAVRNDLGGLPAAPTKAIPEGWCEQAVMPWVDAQTDGATLTDANRRLAAAEAAYRELGVPALEITKARRYAEVRIGELLLDGAMKHNDDGLPSNHSAMFKRFAKHRALVLEHINAAVDPEDITRAAVTRVINAADPAAIKARAERRKHEKQIRNLGRTAQHERDVRLAAQKRGDQWVKARGHLQKYLEALDVIIEEECDEQREAANSFADTMAGRPRSRSELFGHLEEARGKAGLSWDAFARALKVE